MLQALVVDSGCSGDLRRIGVLTGSVLLKLSREVTLQEHGRRKLRTEDLNRRVSGRLKTATMTSIHATRMHRDGFCGYREKTRRNAQYSLVAAWLP